MKHFYIAIIFIFFIPFIGLSQCPPDSLNVTKLYHFDDDGVTKVSGYSFNDCWGYIDNAGNEYAILGGMDSIYVFDITNPATAYKVDADYVPYNSLWRDFKTYDHYLYAVSDQGSSASGLLVYDLDSLSVGKLHKVGGYTDLFTRAHNIFVDNATAKLYVAGTNTVNKGLIIYDLSTDAMAKNPSLIKAVNFDTLINVTYSTYIHDVFVRNDTAYCSHGYAGYYIWDLTNPTSLTSSALIGSMDNTTATLGGYVHSSWNSTDNDYAVVATEVNGSFPGHRKLFIVDQTDMTAPFVDTTWKEPLLDCIGELNNVPHNPMLRGDTMFVSYYHDGVQLLDFGDPLHPKRIGYYDTYPSNNNYSGYKGNWGIFPFFPSGNFIASDGENGLFVFRYIPPCPNPPEIDPISDVASCNFFVLPTITGSNLTGNQAYFDGPGGTGNSYPEGTVIVTSGTYYAYDGVTDCDAERAFVITVNPSPSVDASLDSEICAGETTTIFAAGSGGTAPYSYTWNQGIGGGQNQMVSPSSTTTYVVTVSDINGCTDTDQTIITVNQLPTPEISGDEELCEGATTNLDAGTGFNSYAWNTGESTQDIVAFESGSYIVSVSDNKGCIGTDEFILTVHPNPFAEAGMDSEICSGETATLNASATNGSEPYVYDWDQGLGGGQSHDVNPVISTAYSVTVTDDNGCSDEDVVNILVNLSPDADAGLDQEICTGFSATISANTSQGTAPFTFLWDQGLGEGQSHDVNPLSTTTFSVTITDDKGCSDVDNLSIVVHDNPAPMINGLNLLCEGNSMTLDLTETYDTYAWNTGATTPSIVIDAAGEYIVTVVDANGCTGLDDIQIIEVDSLLPEITGNLVLCDGAITTLDAGAGYASYAWSTGATTPSIDVSSAGTFSVTVTNAVGCSGSNSASTIISGSPVAQASDDAIICSGTSVNISATAIDGMEPYMYTWDQGLGEGQDQTVAPLITTIYTVTVTDANGCTGTDQTIINVPAPITADAGSDQSICFGQSTSVFVTASGGTEPFQYNWDQGLGEGMEHTVNPEITTTYSVTVTDAAGCQIIDQVVVSVNPELDLVIEGASSFCDGLTTELSTSGSFSSYAWNTGDSTPSITVSTEGQYSLTVTDTLECSATENFDVIVVPLPEVQADMDIEICAGDSVLISANANSGADPFTFNWDQGLGEGQSHSIIANASTAYSVTLTDANNCSDTDQMNITVHELPALEPIENKVICFGDSTEIHVQGVGGSASFDYLWDQGLGDGQNHIVHPDTTTVYAVTVTDENACFVESKLTVEVYPEIIPGIEGETFICGGQSTALSSEGIYASYLWSTGDTLSSINVEIPQVYSLTVTDENGCEGVNSIEVFVVDSLEVNIIGDQSICEGSFTILDAGEGYASYVWSTGDTSQTISVTEQSMYSVTVTNGAGCTGSANLEAIIVQNPIVDSSGDAEICLGESTEISAVVTGGIPPINYSWSEGLSDMSNHIVSPTESTDYYITVTDSIGCTDHDSLTIHVNSLPDTSVTFMAPGSLMAEQEGASYQWLDCNNNFEPIAGETDIALIVNQTGDYAVEITFNGCVDTSSCHFVLVSDTKDLSLDKIRIYPVPASNHIIISSEDLQVTGMFYRIISLEGKLASKGIIGINEQIDISALKDGMYFIELKGRMYKLIKV